MPSNLPVLPFKQRGKVRPARITELGSASVGAG
jgi:hypothetical protein